MFIPNNFKFHISGSDFIYSAHYDWKEDVYHIAWVGGDTSVRSSFYSKKMVEIAFKRRIWKLIDTETNQGASLLLEADDL